MNSVFDGEAIDPGNEVAKLSIQKVFSIMPVGKVMEGPYPRSCP